MKFATNNIRRRLASSLMAFASTLSVATAKFEKDPQSCGMMTVQLAGKRNQAGEKTED